MKENFKSFLIILIIIQLYRFFVLLNSHYDLYVDEAYYWGWSREFSFGYYSKPPMIAWVISIFTSLCGDSEFCVKLPSLIIYPITSLFIYLSAKELFDEKVAFYSGVIFITLPAVSLSSLIISTDVVLLLFWSMAFYFFIKALKSDRTLYWILAGVSAGLGLLSKYTMIIFLFSVFLYLLIDKKSRIHLKNPKLYITALIAALIYLPNLYWNAQHQFISFMHTKEISHIADKSHFHFSRLFEFLGAQFAVFGPVFFALFLYLLFRPVKDERYKILYAFSVPFFAIISLQAFLSRAFANWAAPTYVAATILVAAAFIKRKKVLIAGIIVNIVMALLFYHYHSIASALNIELSSKTDPYKRVRGYKELAKELKPLLKTYKDTKFLFDSRSTMAEMIYYLRPHLFDSVMYNPQQKPKSQYHMFTDLNRHIGEDFIYVTQNPDKNITNYFQKAKLIKKITIPLYKDYSRRYYLYYLSGFKGY